MKILKQAYPLEIALKNNLRIGLFTGVFISLFLYVFQPIDVLFQIGSFSIWICMVYGFISFTVMILCFYIVPNRFSSIFNEKYWTVRKETIRVLMVVLFIATANIIFTLLVFLDRFDSILSLIPSVVCSTFILALFPTVAIVFYRQNIYLKRYLKQSDLINASISQVKKDQDILVVGMGKKEEIRFLSSNLLFVKSQGNYCSFIFENNKKEEVIRSSLTQIDQQISAKRFYKCHRSYIVNLDKVLKVSGNAQGLRLHFEHAQESIPVSRSLSNEIRTLLTQL